MRIWYYGSTVGCCLGIALLPSCYESHTYDLRHCSDAGLGLDVGCVGVDGSNSMRFDASADMDATFADAGPPSADGGPGPMVGDSGRPTAMDDAGGECDTLGGFRVCGPESGCSRDCPLETECREGLRVCRPAMRDSDGRGDACEFELDTVGLTSIGWTGNPCAVLGSAQDGTDENPYSGVGMPPSYCTAAIDAGLDVRCVYSDGTIYRNGPPATSCPVPFASGVAFCGGACAGAECPRTWDRGQHAHSCVGLSDDRGYGVCAFGRHRCDPGNVSSQLDECEGWYGRPCSCLVPLPSPVDNLGFPVLQETCQRYVEDYPEHVRCMDRSWR